MSTKETLDQIRARVVDCRTYNFGMYNADKLAHEDAPLLLDALQAIDDLASHMPNAWANEVRATITQALEGATK